MLSCHASVLVFWDLAGLGLLDCAQLHMVPQVQEVSPACFSCGRGFKKNSRISILGLRQVTGSTQIQREKFQSHVIKSERAEEASLFASNLTLTVCLIYVTNYKLFKRNFLKDNRHWYWRRLKPLFNYFTYY